jgi:hypothetical protein|tara:strand:- start:625 stop:1119 length:495 start_codon:yes stop_codon:yes gene_type:complete
MSKEFKGPLDYIDVASRIVEFRGKFPDGSLTQVDLQFLNFAGKDWVVYTAAAYRSPEDQNPGIGTAWEPVPGPTRFTKDSELQNAETAAWGRAMMASLAVDARKGIASSEEVRNRTVEMRDFVTEAAKAKTVEELRHIYNEARQSNAPKDSLASITALADGFSE